MELIIFLYVIGWCFTFGQLFTDMGGKSLSVKIGAFLMLSVTWPFMLGHYHELRHPAPHMKRREEE